MSDVLQILPQQIVFGLALGSVYGLIALGYTMVYGILFMINFAHGEIFTLGAYVGWWVLALLLREKIGGLKKADIELNRKMLAEIAISDPAAFKAIAGQAGVSA